jgi:hypothetical protein
MTKGPGRAAVRGSIRLWLYGAVAILLMASCADIPSKPVPLVHVTGTVTDRDGTPLDGASLEFRPRAYAPPPPARNFAETDSTGAFAIDLYEARYEVRLAVWNALGIRAGRTFEVRIDPSHARLDYRYSDYWIVRGQIIDPTGSPLSEGNLYAYRTQPSSGEYGEARFDSSGFTILLPGGRYEVYASARSGTGFPNVRLTGVWVASDTTWEIRMTGDPLTGVVTGPRGDPLIGVLLYADGDEVSCSARTDAAGAYRMYLPPGAYALRLPASAAPGSVDPPDLPYLAVSGPASYDISVTGMTWSGIVRLSGSGDPVPGAALAATRTGTYNSYPRDTADALGRFEFVVQPGRAYTVKVFEASGVSRARTWSPVIAGGDSTFDLQVDPAGP